MNPKKSSTQLILELTQAFARLPILDERHEYLDRYIGFLAQQMSGVVHLPFPNNFIKKPAVVNVELQRLLSKTTDLEHYLTQIHQSTILAIPGKSARSDLRSACQKMIATIHDALESLHDNNDGQQPNTGGRPAKFRALDLAKSLAGNYRQLTAKPPTIQVDSILEGHPASSDFLRLVTDVFGILEVEGSPEHFAKRAIEEFHKQKEKTPP
ncbi:hypothetical protein [Polynucleobacter brandtiae]|uniref:Uncharacterized protein n=1 Tax=Polynucleobacter brandtiae TaxID=1938816 RepID=A0A2M8VJG0_9BURK|nr:hypothetical protein [Polynucleobacter brandtiae]PJI77148.1 hypothetical protein B0G85_1751 [Polynucleobacter brandtiae]